MDKYVGKRLDGRYEIMEIIGVGGMAVVYKAYDNVDDKIVAIKILKDEFTGNDEFLRRFKNESKAIAVLSHPNIVKVFDVSFGDLIQYIVMEHIDGITLKEHIDREGPLSWSDAVRLTLQILRGLQHAHDKGVVHRDVKPQNIMVLSDGTIKVTDFGIARFARSEQRTITDKAIGSVHYISPEQARGENTDDKADIYSVGVMLYEMITGQLPFQAESAVSVAIMQLQKDPKLPRDINGSIPIGLEQITMHAMQKDAARRYKSAAEMLCDLEEFKKNPAVTFDYDYFIDDSPTKFIPLSEKEESQNGSEQTEKSAIIPILAGISVTFVIAIIVLGIFLYRQFFIGDSAEFKVHDLVGYQYTEIQSNEEYNELYNIVFKYENTDQYDPGEIFRQDPEAGKDIKKGGKLTLYVSLGEKTVVVPDVYGMSAVRAKQELETKGFIVTEILEANNDVDAGNVIRTDPAKSSELTENSKITLYVSSGQPEIPVSLPYLIGLSRADAEAELQRYGLTLGDVTEVNSFTDAGYVVSQDPSTVNTVTVNKGSAVNIGLSRGYLIVDLNMSLPDDFAYDSAYVSLLDENGNTVATSTGMVNLSESGYKYTFSGVKVKKQYAKFTIRLSTGSGISSGYDVLQIQITDENGQYVVVNNFDKFHYPKKATDGGMN